ncbi:hypothetical protein NL676_021925 [Syzygium grande]|nr:hypothetical protein NL676_021925 [Syzygium grande]
MLRKYRMPLMMDYSINIVTGEALISNSNNQVKWRRSQRSTRQPEFFNATLPDPKGYGPRKEDRCTRSFV